jgi:hypothetical protein
MSQQFSCPNCGAPVAFEVRFCGNCGTQLNWPTQQPMPSVIAFRTIPSDKDLIEHSPNELPGSIGHFREDTKLYPTKPTARSLRQGSASEGTTGETITYDTGTRMPYPVLWYATEGAKKAGLEAPTVTIRIKEKELYQALREPHKWEMLCPKCKERIQLKALIDTGKWNSVDLTELFCPYDGETQMLLRQI